MKRFIMAVALTCAFSASIFAGDIPIVPAPPPTAPSVAAQIILMFISLAR